MRPLYESKCVLTLLILAVLTVRATSENIDPDDNGSQYAYGENVGWLNFEPSQGSGVTVSASRVTGSLWSENIGWIKLSPSTYGGILNDGKGNLSGNAWGENIGWIKFNPADGGVSIDSEGNFSGWAYGENIGWIHFQSTTPVAYKVKTAWVYCLCMGDLSSDDWLSPGDVSNMVSVLLPYASSYYWTVAPAGSCGDMNGDGWLSPDDVSNLVSVLLPYASSYYWATCE